MTLSKLITILRGRYIVPPAGFDSDERKPRKPTLMARLLVGSCTAVIFMLIDWLIL